MQLGFLLLEAGSVMSKNTKSIMLKNLLDTFAGGLVWYLFGFYLFLYFGVPDAPSIGSVIESRDSSTNALFLQSFAFANCASTIASGGSASRMKISAHVFIVCVLSCWVYPVFAHWLWAESGWLHRLGAIDFAGGTAVHMVGGISALSGSLSVGPRYGRFIQTIQGTWKVREIKGHNAVYIMTGTCILWYGWFSFNGGSLGYLRDFEQSLRARASLNTLIGGCTGGMAVHWSNLWANRDNSPDKNENDSGKLSKPYEFNNLALGILGGLVAVTPCGPFIPKWAAALTAALGVWFAKWYRTNLFSWALMIPWMGTRPSGHCWHNIHRIFCNQRITFAIWDPNMHQ